MNHRQLGSSRLLAIFLAAALAATAFACGSDDDSGSNPTLARTCSTNKDCPGGEPFCQGGRCVECLADGDCDAPAELCDGVSGRCLDTCTATDQCNGNRLCSPERGACVACLADSDCDDNNRPFCVAEVDECVQCRSSADCDGRPCERGQCRECDDNFDCPDGEPICDLTDNECHECLSNANCGDGEICVDRDCQPNCNADPGICEADQVCNPDSGSCVECLTDVDCPADNPGCIAFECRECSMDSHCAANETCNLDNGRCR